MILRNFVDHRKVAWLTIDLFLNYVKREKNVWDDFSLNITYGSTCRFTRNFYFLLLSEQPVDSTRGRYNTNPTQTQIMQVEHVGERMKRSRR